MDSKIVLYIMLVVGLISDIDCNERPRVAVKQGELEGVELTSESGVPFFAFKGIPYAEPPIGPLRFKLPEEASAWEGVLDASEDGPICPQLYFMNSPPGQEDCLYLNVYTPKIQFTGGQSIKLPVLVYIHGGGFEIGNGMSNYTGPYRIMDRDIVLVSLNYRLGVFGFLNTEDSNSPGNYGLWDQRLALQWIKENIHAFGGNPDQVTIIGHSAGAASVSFHLISSASKGLFHGAILMSGSALNNWAFGLNPLKTAKRLAEEAACPTNMTEEMVECLRYINTEKLLSLARSVSFDISLPFVPSLESPGDLNFIDDLPETLFRYGQINRVPIIIGITDSEGLKHVLGRSEYLTKYLSKEFLEDYLLSVFAKACGMNINAVSKVLELYGNLSDARNPGFLSTVVEVVSDCSFGAGYQQLLLYLVKNNASVYTYKSEHQLKYTYESMISTDNITGVGHGSDERLWLSEKPYILREGVPATLEGDDKEMSEKFKDMWINFAAYGDPTPDNGINVGINWNPVQSEDQIDYLRLRLPLEMTSTAPSLKRRTWYNKATKFALKESICYDF